ncbi:HNH endonuclease family protein [Corynebacterium breve]|uniref:HNH endonuclease family protein n=1 Tax=Corynebacterium breve TaxID=3049799 RepID=A0ABY8VHN4_9CORY|nr:HNH endonuclease family protein [Corynebacterium breve]WIM68466.1 HNH endonuclease family protein [Corynebacterium breve]
MRTGRFTLGVLALVLGTAAVGTLSQLDDAPAAQLLPPPATPEQVVTSPQEQLEALEVKGKAGSGGYSRNQFGADPTACGFRNAVLARHAQYLALDDDNCTVTWGVIHDPYSGETIDFVRGDGQIEIDHVVSLSNAWHTGAFQWSPEKRQEFAHDLDNLIPTRTDLNQQKSGGDAATWLPPNKSFRCEFASLQIRVKYKYGLWVAPAERDALSRQLTLCPSTD